MNLRSEVREITGAAGDYDALLELVGDARCVLLGEASHGTHEFYRERSRITRRLIAEKGFCAVAIEGDWPSAQRVNRYVRGAGADRCAESALRGFERFPAWMWRNRDVLQFVGWLRRHNDGLAPGAPRAGFYGLDLYSLFESMRAIVRYLEGVDPAAARRARERYACFDHFKDSSQRYGYATAFGMSKSCEDEVVAQLVEMRSRAAGASDDPDELFHAEQNARLVKNAEEYYRTMFHGHVSWNLRDQHMAQTLGALALHLAGKVVVWAHNSHVGDARATETGERGELTLGQLVRERYPGNSALVGMTTYRGSVTAASDWDGPVERKRVRDALPGSHEDALHRVGIPRFFVPSAALEDRRLERAIGVVYLPETERLSHYYHADMSRQFDALLHFDETRALEPLDREPLVAVGDFPETYPAGV
ncbi:MAG: erythromycin esterase family protein [Betaproteobacteria bacterium]|nr:MAG: erythromycin esterase family protein [Betaproteobacteria bacterium]